jgi:hypothetical protein
MKTEVRLGLHTDFTQLSDSPRHIASSTPLRNAQTTERETLSSSCELPSTHDPVTQIADIAMSRSVQAPLV